MVDVSSASWHELLTARVQFLRFRRQELQAALKLIDRELQTIGKIPRPVQKRTRTKKSVVDPLIDRIEILLADGVMRKRATLLQELSAADPFALEELSIQKIARSLSRAVEAGRLEIRGRFYMLPGNSQEQAPAMELLKAG